MDYLHLSASLSESMIWVSICCSFILDGHFIQIPGPKIKWISCIYLQYWCL